MLTETILTNNSWNQNNLDEHILEQYHSAKRIKKKMKLLRKVAGEDPSLLLFIEQNKNKIIFLESMIEDKTLLTKKYKLKNKKRKDVLTKISKKDLYRFCRDLYYYTMFFCKVSSSYAEDYLKRIRKGNDSI